MNTDYITWKKLFDEFMHDNIAELESRYLNRLGLKILIDEDYNFSGAKSKWLAVYEKRYNRIEEGNIPIGINYKTIYLEMVKKNTDKDTFNIEAQARITIGHEIGHGLVDYIQSLNIRPEELKNMLSVYKIRECGKTKEEKLVEEFGESCFWEATGVYSCELRDALDELVNYKK